MSFYNKIIIKMRPTWIHFRWSLVQALQNVNTQKEKKFFYRKRCQNTTHWCRRLCSQHWKKTKKNSNFNNNTAIAPQVNLCVRCCCSQLTEKLSVGRRKRQTCTSSRRECRAAAPSRLRTKHSHVLPKILKLWSKYVKTENSTKYAFV